MKQIAILFRNWSTRRYEAIRGVAEYARATPGWRLLMLDQLCRAGDISRLADCDVDGIIACLDGASPEVHDAVTRLKVPVLNVGTALSTVPTISVSPASIAELVATQLASHELTSVALVSTPGHQNLARAVSNAAQRHNRQFHHLVTEPNDSLLPAVTADCPYPEFLSSIPKPLGIVASCDLLALDLKRFLDQQDANIQSHQVPLISCRDSFQCALPQDAITAIREPTYQLGLEAARAMNAHLNGHEQPLRDAWIDATEVSVRVSTLDPAADLLIARAMTFIRDNSARGLSVPDVLAFLDVSRVTFERRFRDAVGRSPGEEIRRVRLEHARKLLLSSDAPIGEIAIRCGFDTPSRFSTFFRHGTGRTPSEFRRDGATNHE
ncbi:MAG: helix-turn-helix domain-containing protein [Planctomycetaceae bacterium]